MKTLILIGGLTLSTITWAVDTKNCPAVLNVNYDRIDFLNNSKIIADATDKSVNPAYALASSVKLQWIKSREFKNVKMKLVSKENSKCHYLPVDLRPRTQSEETRIFTSNGRVLLRISLQTNGESFWIYHDVTSYSHDEITVSNHSGYILGIDYPGGQSSVIKLGYAVNLTLTTVRTIE